MGSLHKHFNKHNFYSSYLLILLLLLIIYLFYYLFYSSYLLSRETKAQLREQMFTKFVEEKSSSSGWSMTSKLESQLLIYSPHWLAWQPQVQYQQLLIFSERFTEWEAKLETDLMRELNFRFSGGNILRWTNEYCNNCLPSLPNIQIPYRECDWTWGRKPSLWQLNERCLGHQSHQHYSQ